MKTILAIALVSLASAGAFAAEHAKPTAAVNAPVAKATKVSRLEARKACQDEGKKGKDLKSCVREKLEKVHT